MKIIYILILALAAASCQHRTAPSAAGTAQAYDINKDSSYYTNVMKRYWLVMLRKGPNRTQDAESAKKIQAAHINNIVRLAEEGKILMAGPMGAGSGDLSGIFIMNCRDSAEVHRLVSTDSAVITGRLVFDYYPWWVSGGKYIFK